MHRSCMLLLGLLVCSVLGIGVFCGCEDGPDTDNVDSQFDNSGTTTSPSGTTSASTTLTNNGAVASFSVAGASGSTSWSVQDISKGTILTQSSTSATYQRASAGDNVVIATSGGNAAYATVSQP